MTEHERFIEEHGEAKTLDYNLNEDSVVFEVGGYKGKFTKLLHDKFNCNIHVFEPIHEFFDVITDGTTNNDKIMVYNFGISDKNRSIDICANEDRTSIHMPFDGEREIIQLRTMDRVLYLLNILHVDLLNINTEGDEYPLLQHMIDKNLVQYFDNIQVQFHDFIPDAVNMRENIRKGLEKTHKLKYSYDFIWEAWSRQA
jgi:FkbM family methyltransferase